LGQPWLIEATPAARFPAIDARHPRFAGS